MHGPGCGHEAVPHDSHIDYLVSVQRASQHSPVWQLVAAVLMCRPEGLQHMMLQHHITPTKSLSIVCPQVGDELHHVVAGLCCPTGCLGDVSGAVVSHGRVSVLRRRRVRISPAAIARMEHKLDRAAGHVAMAEPLRCALSTCPDTRHVFSGTRPWRFDCWVLHPRVARRLEIRRPCRCWSPRRTTTRRRVPLALAGSRPTSRWAAWAVHKARAPRQASDACSPAHLVVQCLPCCQQHLAGPDANIVRLAGPSTSASGTCMLQC